MNSPIKIISIEGNIGSGKSTLLQNLKHYYRNNSNVVFLREPVDEWEKIKDANGQTMLQKFYADQQRYSFPFQMMAYISRLKILRDTIREYQETQKQNNTNTLVIITERSLYTDKYVFAKMLYDEGKIEDVNYQIYLHWFNEFAEDFPVSDIVYVNAEPKKCHERIHTRARPGEEIIPLSYLENCHKYHTDFLKNFQQKLVLDGNVNIYENEQIVEHWLETIHKHIFNAKAYIV
jgi:deoxyadenosine/deoxycytidine kinase